ncbi:hypothetical protein GJ744_004026 [Endocarpon pusillum]|uniref:Uncharacterized protein n=1 Tax=Endocarpon pusillum TaxID=364733 RepID=A0A8H7A649_9EURO|nr:hypothetical protein GJ744_004026 [Endocarpon pusillum]
MAAQLSKVGGRASPMPAESSSTRNQLDKTTSTVPTPNASTSAVPEVNKPAPEVHPDNRHLEHRAPGTYDHWYEKYGWKGFLDWNILREDVPADRWILGSAWPGLPQFSPRSEARIMAQNKNLLANPPKRVMSPQSQRRKNERIAIFETRAQRDARLERLAQDEDSIPQEPKSATVDDQKRLIQEDGATTELRAEVGAYAKEFRGKEEQLHQVHKGGPTSNMPNKEIEKDKESKGLGSDFVVREEKQILSIRKPGEGSLASSTGPASVTRPNMEIPSTAAQPSSSAATAEPLGHKLEQGSHHRQKSSLSAAAPVFHSQRFIKSPGTASSLAYSTTPASYQQPIPSLGNRNQPLRPFTGQDNALRPINSGWLPKDTRSRKQKRAALHQQHRNQDPNGAHNSAQTPSQARATAAAYVPPIREAEQNTSSAAVPPSSAASNPTATATAPRPAAGLPPPTAPPTTHQRMGSFSLATLPPRSVIAASASTNLCRGRGTGSGRGSGRGVPSSQAGNETRARAQASDRRPWRRNSYVSSRNAYHDQLRRGRQIRRGEEDRDEGAARVQGQDQGQGQGAGR